MREMTCSRARVGLTAVVAAAILFVFGADPVRAQTAPARARRRCRHPPRPNSRRGRCGGCPLTKRWRWRWSRTSTCRSIASTRRSRTWRSRSPGAAGRRRSSRTFGPSSQTNPPTDIFGGAATRDQREPHLASGHPAGCCRGAAPTTRRFWNTGRFTTNNIFSSFNPQLNSTLGFNYTQPLLRNFKIDATRQQVLVSRKNREISDVQLRQSIAATDAQREERVLGPRLRDQQPRRAAAVAAARAAAVSATTARASRSAPWRRSTSSRPKPKSRSAKKSVILAEAAIRRQEDSLRALISNPDRSTRLLERPPRAGRPADTSSRWPSTSTAAVRNALAIRTDLIDVAQAARSQRHLDSLLPQPVDARRQRAGQLQRDSGWPARSSSCSPRPSRRSVSRSQRARLRRCARRRLRVRLPDVVDAAAGELPDWRVERRRPTWPAPVCRTRRRANSCRRSELQVTTQIRDLGAQRADQRASASNRRERRAPSPKSGSKPSRRSSPPA